MPGSKVICSVCQRKHLNISWQYSTEFPTFSYTYHVIIHLNGRKLTLELSLRDQTTVIKQEKRHEVLYLQSCIVENVKISHMERRKPQMSHQECLPILVLLSPSGPMTLGQPPSDLSLCLPLCLLGQVDLNLGCACWVSVKLKHRDGCGRG